jgi:hypothetical protein
MDTPAPFFISASDLFTRMLERLRENWRQWWKEHTISQIKHPVQAFGLLTSGILHPLVSGIGAAVGVTSLFFVRHTLYHEKGNLQLPVPLSIFLHATACITGLLG